MLVLLCVTAAAPARAQTPASGDPETSSAVDVLTRAALRLTAERLSGDDPRFVWDANFGGELDLVDYGAGRLTFTANYQVILGDEIRTFDPNQGNYVLAAAASARVAGLELAGLFHHESRHLSDRSKTEPVDWNMAGAMLLIDTARASTRLQGRVDMLAVVQKSFVDYRWQFEGGFRAQQAIRSPLAVIGAARLRLLGVDGSRNRGTQAGFRGEGGVRLDGVRGALELFVAVERRVDPYPLQFDTERWVTVGFRLLSR